MNLWSIFDLPSKKIELLQLRSQSESEKFWDDQQKATSVMKKISDLEYEIIDWQNLEKHVLDTLELIEFDDESLKAEIENELEKIDLDLSTRQLSAYLSHKYDKGNALLAIHAGAGGTDSQDWAAMLMRMYLRWTEKRGFISDILDITEGEEAGIKSTTIAINGKYAYGYLKSEKGVHRLVRLSPFDSAHRRHTSFALVEVLPEVSSSDLDFKINPDDLRVDVFRSSGAGGQSVQKNATAVRITHNPTGIIVICQNERSQLQNRENAMRVLRSRLLALKEAEKEKEISNLRGDFVKAEWGSQIRSYILHPYQMVKDHRTDFEVGNTNSILDGELDPFIEEYLKNQSN